MVSFFEGKKLTEIHATSFAHAAAFLPDEKKGVAYAIYGFCRATDEIIDGPGSREEKEIRLDAWKTELAHAWNGNEGNSALIVDFVHACRTHSISPEWGFRLIEGLRADLDARPMRGFDDLYAYCYSAASIPGILIAHAMDAPVEAMEYAVSLGIGMQLTNILRDLAEDAQMGRCYLPLDEMAQFGYSLSDLQARKISPSFVSLMRFNIARAREYYAHAENGIALLPPRVQLAMRLCLVFYREILVEIERNRYRVFTSRVFVPDARKNELVAQEKIAFSPRIEA